MEGKDVTSQVVTSALAPAEIVTRVIAYIIDIIVLGIVYLILGAIIVTGAGDVVGPILRAIILAAVGFVYFGYGWTKWRASPGQRVLGLRTVKEDGATLTWNDSVMRWAYLFGPSVVGSLIPEGFLSLIVNLAVLAYVIYLLYTAATDSRRQGFHDKQAHTLVVRST